jgi:hypothetical protein
MLAVSAVSSSILSVAMLWMEEVPIEKWDVSDLVVAVFASFVSWIFGVRPVKIHHSVKIARVVDSARGTPRRIQA